MASTTTVSNISHTYLGTSAITFSPSAEGLSVTIDTKRLHMRSVHPIDLASYVALYGNPVVMEKFARGTPMTPEAVALLVDSWVKRWQGSNPYAGLAVFKKDTNTFMGHVGLYSPAPESLDLSGIGHEAFWGDRYASEALAAVVQEYIPATIREGYALNGKPVTRITATARPDNEASIRLLQRIGMCFTHESEKFGAMRNHYMIDVGELCQKYGQKPPSIFKQVCYQ